MHTMKNVLAGTFVATLVGGAQAGLIDDYSSGDLSNYTSTVILDANGGASNVANWQTTGGQLELNTTTYDGIEQYAFIYNGLTLAVGEEVQLDISRNSTQLDIGLYVGGSAPVTNTRANYLNVYGRDATRVLSRGFLGNGELNNVGGTISEPAYDKLFILRDGTNDYELGYYNGATRIVISDRNGMTGNDASYVGIYADSRGAGVLAGVDNLTVVPEPGSVALLGLGGLLIARRRRDH